MMKGFDTFTFPFIFILSQYYQSTVGICVLRLNKTTLTHTHLGN